jgi:hypothetical protein
VGVSTENILDKLALKGLLPGYFQPSLAGLVRLSNLSPGLRPGLLSAVPTGLNLERVVITQTLKAIIICPV